ncbi:MAG: MBL fold metallo-hydrolase [Bacteroidetes bacterium]|nr:MAG: MBL fold metallo-hydrolase [Bacteroidota bacterium]
MIKIKIFPQNLYQMNTILLYDETGEGVLIDAGNSSDEELQQIVDFTKQESIQLKKLLNTHGHIDHIVGNKVIIEHFGLKLYAHKAGLVFYETASQFGSSLGITIEDAPKPDVFIEDGDIIEFGNSKLKVLYTPGHADGSVCFYSEADEIVVVGDVLFQQSIGRTDLPTGDYDLLVESIRTKLYTLPDSTDVFPGHGPSTRISYEKADNPFVSPI